MVLRSPLDGRHVYVTNYGDTTVSVIKTSMQKVATTITVGDHPPEVAICSTGLRRRSE